MTTYHDHLRICMLACFVVKEETCLPEGSERSFHQTVETCILQMTEDLTDLYENHVPEGIDEANFGLKASAFFTVLGQQAAQKVKMFLMDFDFPEISDGQTVSREIDKILALSDSERKGMATDFDIKYGLEDLGDFDLDAVKKAEIEGLKYFLDTVLPKIITKYGEFLWHDHTPKNAPKFLM